MTAIQRQNQKMISTAILLFLFLVSLVSHLLCLTHSTKVKESIYHSFPDNILVANLK